MFTVELANTRLPGARISAIYSREEARDLGFNFNTATLGFGVFLGTDDPDILLYIHVPQSLSLSLRSSLPEVTYDAIDYQMDINCLPVYGRLRNIYCSDVIGSTGVRGTEVSVVTDSRALIDIRFNHEDITPSMVVCSLLRKGGRRGGGSLEDLIENLDRAPAGHVPIEGRYIGTARDVHMDLATASDVTVSYSWPPQASQSPAAAERSVAGPRRMKFRGKKN